MMIIISEKIMAKGMKILILSHVSDYIGGAERSMVAILDSWVKDYGIEPVIIMRAPVGKLLEQIKKRNWKYYAVDYTYWSDKNLPDTSYRILINSRRNSKAIRKIEQIIEDESPDFVATNSIIAPWAAIAAYYMKIPHVWFVREYGDLDHGRKFEIGQEKTFEDIGFLSDFIFTNSKTMEAHVNRYVKNTPISTIYTPFNFKELEEKINEGVKNPFTDKGSLKLVLTSGSITESKGHMEAVKAVGELTKQGYNLEICLIGKKLNDDFQKRLEQEISKYKISKKVHFAGFVSNPMSLVKYADAGIMSSRKEAFGRVTFEFMAAKKAVIGSNAGATPELVKDNISGYLFEPNDLNTFIDALKNYANDSSLVKKHGKNGYEAAKKMMAGKHNANHAYKNLVKIIEGSNDKNRQVFNYSHRWLEYPDSVIDYLSEIKSMSFKSIVKMKTKETIRPLYIKYMNIKNRLTIK